MKKTMAILMALAAISTTALASPQTSFRESETEINIGMWNPSAHSNGYKSDDEWNFLGGVTYGISPRWAVQYQYTGLHTEHTNGNMNEINALYSFHPQVAGFVGWNRIYMKDFPRNKAFGNDEATNNIIQAGIIARQPINDVLDVYAKGALGSEETSIWEAGVNLAIDRNVDLNAGYHYMNTRGSDDHNVSFKGFIAGVSYRFGGKDPDVTSFAEDEKDYDYEGDSEDDVSTVSTSDDADVTITPEDNQVAPANDYYVGSVLFDADSAALKDAQKTNVDAFVKAAKETGHTYKLVGRADNTGSADYNRDLSYQRVKAVRDYAVAHGVDADKIVDMVKGADSSSAAKAEDRRVDIFEHK